MALVPLHSEVLLGHRAEPEAGESKLCSSTIHGTQQGQGEKVAQGHISLLLLPLKHGMFACLSPPLTPSRCVLCVFMSRLYDVSVSTCCVYCGCLCVV